MKELNKISIKNKFVVKPIKPEETYVWLLKKHYAHRIPSNINYTFGIYDDDLQGICCFGLSGNINNNMLGNFKMLELQRLVINEGLGENVLSYFVSQSLNLLPKPMVIISYADPNKGHCGYIYQSTNWIYTGVSSNEAEIIINGIPVHRKSLFDKHGTSSRDALRNIYKDIVFIEQEGKHRYYYFLGNKKEKELMKLEIADIIKPYPKGDNQRYDASYIPNTQQTLF